MRPFSCPESWHSAHGSWRNFSTNGSGACRARRHRRSRPGPVIPFRAGGGMRNGRASTTAELVALWRALGHEGHTRVPSFSDPHARALLGPTWAKRFTHINSKLADRKARLGEVDSSRWDWLLVRVAALDRLLTDALGGGVRQLVILGAGFDTRAWRLSALAGVDVFEIDHPDTQAVKRDRVRALPAAVSPPRFVAVDFSRDRLSDRLARAGHRPDRPT